MIPPSVAPESPPTAAPFSVVVQPTIDTVRIRNRNIFFIDHPFFFYEQVSLRGCFLAEAIFLKFRLLHQTKSEIRNDTKKFTINYNCSRKNRSASSAAIHPDPAAVTACR